MELDKTTKETGDVPTSLPKKRKRKWLVAGCAVFLLAAVIGAFYFINKESAPAFWNILFFQEKTAALQFKNIEVNLADRSMMHYLKTSMVLEYQGKELGREMEEKNYRLKDAIIKVLREKSVSDLDSTEETSAVKAEILKSVNKELTQGEVSSVYFEEFIIQ